MMWRAIAVLLPSVAGPVAQDQASFARLSAVSTTGVRDDAMAERALVDLAELRQLPAPAGDATAGLELRMRVARRLGTWFQSRDPTRADPLWEEALECAARMQPPAEWVGWISFGRARFLYEWGPEHHARARAVIDAALQQRSGSYVHLQLLAARISDALGEPTRAKAALANARAAAHEVSDPAARAALLADCLEVESVQLTLAGRLDLAAKCQAELAAARGPGHDGRLDRLRLVLAAEQWEPALELLAEVCDEPRLASYRANFLLHDAQVRWRRGDDADDVDARLRAILASGTPCPPDVRRAIVLERAGLALAQQRNADALALLAEVRSFYRQFGPVGIGGLRWCTVRARAALVAANGADDNELRAALGDIDRAWDILKSRWTAEPASNSGAGFLQFGERRDVLAMRIALRARLAPSATAGFADARAALLEAEALDSFARLRHIAAPTDPADLERLLPDRGGLLVYVPAPIGSHVLVWSADARELLELPSDRPLRAWGRQVEAALTQETRADAPELQRATRALADWALGSGIGARIASWRSVGIVGRELLARLPFELLDGAGGPLATERAIAYLPSLSIAAWLLERRTRAAPSPVEPALDLVLVATTAPSEQGVAPVVETDAVLALARRFEPSRTLLRSGATATLATLSEAGARQSALLEIIAHGERDPLRERPTGLRLADRTVWADDLERHSLPDVVLLLSCGAGRTPLKRGDSVGHHLGGAALAAGAAVVGLADHDLEAEPTLALLDAFHLELPASGFVPAEALRRARTALTHPSNRATALALLRLEGLAHLPMPTTPRIDPTPSSRERWTSTWPWLVGLAVLIAWWVRRGRRLNRRAASAG